MNAAVPHIPNAPTNAAKMLRQRAENASETPLQRPERLCACGCGACFVPKNNSQLYVNAQHRQRRFIEDKKDAVFNFVYELLRRYGAALETAVRKAQEARDHYFTHWCKCLSRCGYIYDTKVSYWKRTTLAKRKVTA